MRLLLLLLLPTIGIGPVSQGVEISGEGARPLSPRVVSLWLIQNPSSSIKELPFIILLRGEKDWYQKQTSHSSRLGDRPIIMDWSVGATRIRVEYSPEKGSIKLFGAEFRLNESNLLLVDKVDGDVSKVVVKSGGFLKMRMPIDEETTRFVLTNSKAAMDFTNEP
jgi:hypothetical protein